jgi:hypothetical protein
LILDYSTASGNVHMLMDTIAMGRGRTELTLIVAVPYSQRAGIDAAELRLARIMVSRTRA